jgi:hypothetical protein
VILPKVDKCPVKPQLEPLVGVGIGLLGRDGVRLERVRLDGFEPSVLAQASHAGNKLVWADAGMQDGMQGGPGDFTRLAIEFVADTKQECAQALY